MPQRLIASNKAVYTVTNVATGKLLTDDAGIWLRLDGDVYQLVNANDDLSKADPHVLQVGFTRDNRNAGFYVRFRSSQMRNADHQRFTR